MYEYERKPNQLEMQESKLQPIIRPFNPDSEADLNALKSIEQDPEKIYWFESMQNFYLYADLDGINTMLFVPDPKAYGNYDFPPDFIYTPPTDDELICMMNGKGRYGEEHKLYALEGVSGLVSEEEIGVAQGYVRIFKDEIYRIDEMHNNSLTPDEDTEVYVIEYAMKPGAAPHQMSKAVPLVVDIFREEHPNAMLVAYVIDRKVDTRDLYHNANEASMAILEKTGFTKAEIGIRYDDSAEKPDIFYYLLPNC